MTFGLIQSKVIVIYPPSTAWTAPAPIGSAGPDETRRAIGPPALAGRAFGPADIGRRRELRRSSQDSASAFRGAKAGAKIIAVAATVSSNFRINPSPPNQVAKRLIGRSPAPPAPPAPATAPPDMFNIVVGIFVCRRRRAERRHRGQRLRGARSKDENRCRWQRRCNEPTSIHGLYSPKIKLAVEKNNREEASPRRNMAGLWRVLLAVKSQNHSDVREWGRGPGHPRPPSAASDGDCASGPIPASGWTSALRRGHASPEARGGESAPPPQPERRLIRTAVCCPDFFSAFAKKA